VLRAYFGHHKCGTRWILGILDEAAVTAGLRTHEVFRSTLGPGDLAAAAREHRPDIIQVTNARARWLAELGELRGFHVVRDPRDVLVSAYFSHRNSHPTGDFWTNLDRIRDRLDAASKSEGLLHELDLRRGQFSAMLGWRPRPDVLEIRMEDLTVASEAGFEEIFRFLDLLGDRPGQVTASTLRDIVAANSFEALSGGRAAGESDETSHYRKGVAGDWVEHFEPVHLAVFGAQWTDLLLALGYETDPDWWRARFEALASGAA
jgi:hypothetical protein